jgi:hypothetical protein
VGYMTRSSGLLHVKASLARVSQSGLKTGGGVTAGCVGVKLKTDRLMRQVASDPAILALSFSFY